MVRIRLFCVAGMLTSCIVNKMNDAAKLKELEVDIQAFPESRMFKSLKEAEVVMLGPQIAYKLSAVKAICDPLGIACDVMQMRDLGMMNGERILDRALVLAKEMKEKLAKEAIEKEKAEKEAREREEIERKNAEQEAKEKEAIEREKAERETKEKEAIEREKAERETKEKEAMEREKAENKANEEMEMEKVEERVMSEIEKNEGVCDQMSELNSEEYKTIINNAKELILRAEKEIYISTNIDISVFKDEFSEISQRGARVTVVSFKEYCGEELPIDKLYTYIDEKNKNKDAMITIVVDDNSALIAEKDSEKEEISNVVTDNSLLVSAISKNIINDIYLLKLRDNIAFKLKDM